MLDTSMILSLSIPEVTEIKRKILQDRKYKVPVFFFSYIDDDFIIDTLILDERSESRDAFIQDYQKNSGFHSYKKLIITLMEHGSLQLENLYLFDPTMITKHCKRLLHILTEEDVIHIMTGWYQSHDGAIPFGIVYLYMTKICGRLWFLSIEKSMRILRNKIYDLQSFESDLPTEILHQIFLHVPYINSRICSGGCDKLGYNLITYYGMNGSKFVRVNKLDFMDNNVISTIQYLKYAKNIEKLPDNVARINQRILSVYTKDIPEYKKAVKESLSKNANNLHLVTWGFNLKPGELESITSSVLSSDIPLKDFSVYVELYKLAESCGIPINIRFTKDFLNKFIISGTDVNTMLDYIDIRNCWFEIIQHGSDDSIRKLIRNEDPYRGSTTGETIGEFLLNNVDWISGSDLKMLTLVCEDVEIFNRLSTERKDYITRCIKIDWMIEHFPNLLLSDYFKTFVNNSTTDIRKLCMLIPDVLNYLPAHYVSLSMIQYTAKTRGYVAVPYVRLTIENVLSLVEDDCGYGYILDLPTFVQMNAIIITILNRIYGE